MWINWLPLSNKVRYIQFFELFDGSLAVDYRGMTDDEYITFHLCGEGEIDMLAWADSEPRQAVINFSSMNPGKFERWSWFRRDRLIVPSIYMFLKDDRQHYYLGTPSRSLVDAREELIDRMLRRYHIDRGQVTTVGSSMGGYAAVYFALSMGFGRVISINPQVDFESAGLHKYSLWQRKMSEANWVNLDEFVEACSKPACHVLLRHGQYAADQAAALKLSAAMTKRRIPFDVQVHESNEHGWTDVSMVQLHAMLNTRQAGLGE